MALNSTAVCRPAPSCLVTVDLLIIAICSPYSPVGC